MLDYSTNNNAACAEIYNTVHVNAEFIYSCELLSYVESSCYQTASHAAGALVSS